MQQNLKNNYFNAKNADYHYCPRCNKKAINKDARRCLNCNGRVVWPSDECLMDHLDEYGDDWYCWYAGLFNKPAWHHSSYFRARPAIKEHLVNY